MRTFDLSPMFRSTVGFDRMTRLLDSALQADQPAYPPYNIERAGDDEYRITLAVAGFGEDELDVTLKDGTLFVSGKKADGDGRTYLYRGIAERAFSHRFHLADHIEVTGARLENGLLHIDLVREIPEAMKPKSIAISRGGNAKKTTKVIEQAA